MFNLGEAIIAINSIPNVMFDVKPLISLYQTTKDSFRPSIRNVCFGPVLSDSVGSWPGNKSLNSLSIK